jgi:hypothetical protein
MVQRTSSVLVEGMQMERSGTGPDRRTTPQRVTDATARFEAREIDVVVFVGPVPPDRKAGLREEIGAINPRVVFVQGLAGRRAPRVRRRTDLHAG